MKNLTQHNQPVQGIKSKLLGSIREIVFGLEDSLVSTIGVVAGIAAGTGDKKIVILSGIVLVVVEALSMAAGSFLSSQSHHRLMLKEMREAPQGSRKYLAEDETPILSGAVMGVVYILGGLIPILPFVIFSIPVALVVAFAGTVLGLFALGIWSASVTGDRRLRTAVEMVLVSASAAVIGYVIGRIMGAVFGLQV